MQAKSSDRISQVLFWWLLAGLLIGLYSPMLFGRIPAFRDAFHFYYPFEAWLDQQAAEGEWLPQYNPFDGTGINTVGESSSYLFYPLRILWWIPWLTVAQRLGLFLLVHNMLAAVGAAYAAKRLGLSGAAIALAACAYALSGPVVFQHTNPVYLIGAAWLPWVFAELIILASTPNWFSEPALSHSPKPLSKAPVPRLGVTVGATSLMVLGGEPQAAMHAGLLALLAWLYRFTMNRQLNDACRSFMWLAQAGLLVLGLTCIQWLPTLLWLQQSNRVALQPALLTSSSAIEKLPPLLEPVLAELSSAELLSKEHPSQLKPSTYAYSIAPWHLCTLIWSTAGGHVLPQHSRWLQSFSAEPRMWCPSLSVGLIPALLVTLGWTWRRTSRPQRFLFGVCLFTAAAMLGDYTLIWLLRQTLNLCGAQAWATRLPSDQVSGLYWILTECVPFYSAFRYPAKWSVAFACAMSLCAAAALERVDRFDRLKWMVAGLCLLTLALLILAAYMPVAWQDTLTNWLAAAPGDPWLGSPLYESVRSQWIFAMLTTLMVLTALLVTLALRSRIASNQLHWLWISLTIVELGISSASWIVVCAPPSAEDLQAQLQDAPLPPVTAAVDRIWSGVGRADFNTQTAQARVRQLEGLTQLQQTCDFQKLFYLGKLHLLEAHRGNVAAFTSLTPRSLALVRQRLARADTLAADNPKLDEALAWLGVSHRLTLAQTFRWSPIANAAPLIEWQPEPRTQPDQQTTPARAQSPNVLDFDCDDFTLRLSTTEPGTIVVRLLQDGGWRVRLVPSESQLNQSPSAGRRLTTLYLTPKATHLGLFQSLNVPAGEWVAYWQYECPGLRLGAIITLVTAVTSFLGFAGLWRFFRKIIQTSDSSRMIQSR